jgi:hypothetical protein
MSRTIQYQRVAHVVAVSAIIASLIACSDSSGPSDPVGTPRPVATVAVTPTARSVVVGRTATLVATAKDADGNVITGRAVQWATSNASIATVSAAGVVTGVAEGTTTVSATVEGKAGQADVTVSPVPVASVRLTPRTVLLDPGATRQLTAAALDAGGNVLEGRTVEWATNAPSVATVSTTGLVQAVAPGYAEINATIEGKTMSSTVTVATPEPAEQYDLVYERRAFNGVGEIRRLSPSTGASLAIPLVVTIPGAYVRDATPSPDGTRIAFTVAWYPEGSALMDGDIYVASTDGSNLRRLTTAEGMDDQPVWSPDGTRIAFHSVRSGHGDIWVMGANGTGQTDLTNDFLPAISNEHSPAWSPDGSRIAYSSDIDNFAHVKLWTMRTDGSDKRRVLPATAGTDVIDMEASWSPDGSQLAFRRISNSDSDIVIVTLSTQVVTRLSMTGVQSYPAWSPDGALIAFSSSHENPMSDIYTMKPDGTGLVRLTNNVDSNWRPRWLLAAAAAVVAR